MGFLQPGIPLEEEKRRRSGIARAFAAVFGPGRKNKAKAPDVTTDKGAGYKPRPEMWQYPVRKNGSRREGRYFRPTARDRFGKFAPRFDLKKFKETQDKINLR